MPPLQSLTNVRTPPLTRSAEQERHAATFVRAKARLRGMQDVRGLMILTTVSVEICHKSSTMVGSIECYVHTVPCEFCVPYLCAHFKSKQHAEMGSYLQDASHTRGIWGEAFRQSTATRRWRGLLLRLRPWVKSIQEVEGRHGASLQCARLGAHVNALPDRLSCFAICSIAVFSAQGLTARHAVCLIRAATVGRALIEATFCHVSHNIQAFGGVSTVGRRDAVAGSNVALTFYFIRFALGLNLLLLAIWAICTVGPFFLHPPTTFRWSQVSAYSAAAVAQGYGLDSSWFVYGAPRASSFLFGSLTPTGSCASLTNHSILQPMLFQAGTITLSGGEKHQRRILVRASSMQLTWDSRSRRGSCGWPVS